MKKLIILLACLATMASCSAPKQESMEELTERVMQTAEQQYKYLYSQLEDGAIPQSLLPNGDLKTTNIYNWISGFFAGTSWYIHEYTGSEEMKKIALEYTALQEPVKHVTDNHDVGFMLYCSYGNALRLTGDESF